MSNELNVKEMTLEQLESMAYKQFVELNRVQTNINILEKEIQERNKVEEPVKKKKE